MTPGGKLEHLVHLPRDAGDGATTLVLLHGRGSDERDLQGLRRGLPDDMVVVTPRAPHPGAPWGYGPGWAWYRYVAEDRVVPETLQASLEELGAFLDRLPDVLGLDPGAVFLGGFSQGGTTSLTWALEHPDSVRGVLTFSGFLPTAVDPVPPVDVPVFWGHGRQDPSIPWTLARRGREKLERAGVPLEARDYDMGHGIAPEELGDAVAWMEQVLDAGDG